MTSAAHITALSHQPPSAHTSSQSVCDILIVARRLLITEKEKTPRSQVLCDHLLRLGSSQLGCDLFSSSTNIIPSFLF